MIETPDCLMYSIKGSVPHLTPDNVRLQGYGGISVILEQVLQADQPASFSKWPATASSKFTLADFLHLRDLVLFCDLRDFSSLSSSSSKLGSNTDRHVLLSTLKGVRQLTLGEYLQIVRQYRPDIMVSLADHIAETKELDQKRVRKSINRTLKWLDQILLERRGEDGRIEDRKVEEAKKRKKEKKERQRNMTKEHQQLDDEEDPNTPVDVQPIATEPWTDVAVFAHVQGAHYEEERIWSAVETAKRDGVDGFIVDTNSLTATSTKNEILKCIKVSIEHLPAQKPRLAYGIRAPENVLKAIALGVDLFDTSYPYQLTEDGKASLYYFGDNPYSSSPTSATNLSSNNRWINLWDEEHRDKFVSILDGCECCACKGGRHTRAYINHLLKTHEMLATVLLMSHNMYQYSKFFAAVREAVKVGTLERYSEAFHETFGVEPARTGEKHPAQIAVEASLAKRNQRFDGAETDEIEATGTSEKSSKKRPKEEAGVDKENKKVKPTESEVGVEDGS
ncbi:Queuine tRNA-ribosyltransferase subunit qtrtd1 [Modicella reniformis]|uniref:Queuine tRNA-ribosyltransferase accessory subunit 2 n=1 Tax=Modicella reniformis TaxID=1440133 RepID=A0A9P6JH62_9FUNG|nr:Queuine tRNA-ribosyltransferase subunit qtrtd1 [Modicella reniformis]